MDATEQNDAIQESPKEGAPDENLESSHRHVEVNPDTNQTEENSAEQKSYVMRQSTQCPSRYVPREAS
jgi:hypothetical protein